MITHFQNARLIDPEALTDEPGSLTIRDGRIEAVGVAVEGTQFTLSRSDWFAILRAARGHEVA